MKNQNLFKLTAILVSLCCHFSAYGQNLDTWKLKNEKKIQNIEKALRIPSINNSSLNIEDRLKTIQINIHNKLGQNPQKQQAIGGVDSGGGNLLLKQNGQFQLLDFFVHKNSSFHSGLESKGPIQTKKTIALEKWGIDRLDRESTVYHETIDHLVSNFEVNSPFLGALVRNAIFNLPIYLVDYEIALQDQSFFLPELEKNKHILEIVTGAVYFKNFGVFVSKKVFDKLHFEDQVGLLVHESLRHLQITHEYYFSDQDLQMITTAIVYPNSQGKTLDTLDFLKGKLREGYLHQVNSEAEKLVKEYICLDRKSSSDIRCEEVHFSEPTLVKAYKKEAELKLLKSVQFGYIDRIINDYRNSGWTRHKDEAQLILQMLSQNKIILLSEGAQ